MSSSDSPITVRPPPPGYIIDLVHPEYIGYQLVIVAIISASLSTFFLLLRLYTRKLILKSLGWDDFWIVLAWLFAFAFSIGDCVETKYGIGTHLWDITIPKFEILLKFQLILASTYIVALAFAKVSICCFYLRILPHQAIRIVVYCTMVFVAAYSFAGLLVIIFPCNPIAAAWDPVLAASPDTKCINRPADYFAQAGLNIVTDLFILILPMYNIWNLQLPIRQKITVSSIFAIGIFVCIVSIIRLRSLVKFVNSTDFSWEDTGIIIWSTVEAHMCIVCACAMTLKPLANRFFPKLLGKSTVTTGPYPSIPGKGSKLASGPVPAVPADSQAYALQSYRQRAEVGEHKAVVSTHRDGTHRDFDGSSQESIIRAADPFSLEPKEDGIYVARTVHVV